MDVDIDEARSDGEAGRIQNFGAVGRFQLAGADDFGDAAVFEEKIFEGVDAGSGVDEVPVADNEGGHARPSFPAAVRARSTTAMRIATPWRTCSRMADCGPSATPAVSSRPRMMEPGCRTRAVGARADNRWP